MTTRRHRRSPRALAVRPSDGAGPPALWVVLLGWLGGGLLATAVATVTESPNDLQYGLVNTAGACAGLLLLTAVRAQRARAHGRGRAPAPSTLAPAEPLPVPVPAQPSPGHDDRRAPALR